MTDRPRPNPEGSDEDLAPELHNAEQEDEPEQAQSVAAEALRGGAALDSSPLDSIKPRRPRDLDDDSTQDLIDHMRDMEQSGRIDMDAYSGEPNFDDNEDLYGAANKEDDLPSDGTSDPDYQGPDEEG